ncbi:hypothetical protein AVEN_64460-1 [Araneus ventricosus]|uniref:Uncharacterized protein n=1 Tax=Araneus ventricosus TaxID=182803 RepID=A0A4Y2P168_ARAVE|nr:hypothetical protein AVEN_64460-1 [Araneus ventricosus]
MKSTRTRGKSDVIGSRRSEPIILSDFLPQFYQGRVWKYAHRPTYTGNRILNLEPLGSEAETLPLGHHGPYCKQKLNPFAFIGFAVKPHIEQFFTALGRNLA